MPEFILEYSENIIEKDSFHDLFVKLHETLTPILSATIPGCVSRAIKVDHFYIGDGNTNNALVHLQIVVKEGRAREVLEKTANQAQEILKNHFFTSLKERNLKITLEVREMQLYLH